MSARRSVVIGGGLAGVTTAYELARRGEAVTLIEAAPDLAAGASFANGGMLTASMSDPWNSPGAFGALVRSLADPYAALKVRMRALPSLLGWGPDFLRHSRPDRFRAATRNAFALARYSVAATEDLEASLDLTYDSAATGTLKIFATQAAAEGPLALARMLEPQGLRHTYLDRAGVLDLEPELAETTSSIACGLYYPDDRSGDARVFVERLAEAAARQGADLRTGVRAERILSRDGRVTGVETGSERIEADRVVIAAGAASPRLAAGLGVRLNIQPAKGYSVTVDASGWNRRPALPVVDDAMHAAVTPLGARIRLAGTAEFAGHDLTIDPARIENLLVIFRRLYPHLADQVDPSAVQTWAGLRPMSSDGLASIGRAGPNGLWINAGHGHLGWTMAVGSARMLADQILGVPPAIDPAPYRPGR